MILLIHHGGVWWEGGGERGGWMDGGYVIDDARFLTVSSESSFQNFLKICVIFKISCGERERETHHTYIRLYIYYTDLRFLEFKIFSQFLIFQ